MSDHPNPVAIVALAKRPDGITLDEIVHITGCDMDSVKVVCENLVADGSLRLKSIVYYSTLHPPKVTVSPFARSMLSKLRCAGTSGLEPGRMKLIGAEDMLVEFAKKGAAVEIGEGIYLSVESYEETVAVILAGFKPGERFALDHAKSKTGLSRKYLIPLLERMEDDGYARRQGNDRIVTKKTSGEDQ